MKNVCVWNPGVDAIMDIGDLEMEDYDNFVCVEPGCMEEPIVISRDEEFVAS